MRIEVSVIITAYNEEDVILDCLKSLEKQTLRDFEVIVVDDGSLDATFKIVSESKFKNFKLKTIRGMHLGPGAGRNLGVKHATGNILVFVDADMTFEKNFLKNLVRPIISGKTNGTFSKYEYVSNWENVWARCWNINKNWEVKRRHSKNYPNSQEVFRAIKRSEFEKVDGFTPGGYNDDWSLYKKLGYKADSAKGAIFYHKNPDKLSEVFNHAKWVSKREYKLRFIGKVVALLRVSLPMSLIIGLYKSIIHKEAAFLIFKPVYDFGEFLGIVSYIFTNKGSK